MCIIYLYNLVGINILRKEEHDDLSVPSFSFKMGLEQDFYREKRYQQQSKGFLRMD